jgi:nucleotide-binding universal stress UspA family protein
MSYKTVLLHCNDKRRLPRLLDPAVALCAEFGAHLIGLSVTPPVAVIPAGMPGTPDAIVIDEQCKVYRGENPAMRAALDAAANRRNVAAEWREDDAGSGAVADVVLRHAHVADLIVASQTAPDWPGSLDLDIADGLALESGRPALIIPNKGPQQAIGKRIVIAWNDRREAARALFDALPLLQRAEKVLLVQVDPPSLKEGAGTQLNVRATLARHGVACEAEVATSRHGNVGDALISHCERARADLLVMGCYGHSRLREIILGGATRDVLANMTIPVLMSH